MKLYLIILLICSSIFAQSEDEIPADIQRQINEAVDYYRVSLFDESKKLLLKLLYSDKGEKHEAEIRYHLGIASYYEGEVGNAHSQWNLLRKKYPTSQRSQEISRAFGIMIQDDYSEQAFREEQFEFNQEMKYSFYFWDKRKADSRFLFGELKDPNRAVAYYKKLLVKYDDPDKKFKIALQLFYLYAGYNINDFGYKSSSAESSNNIVIADAERMLAMMEAQVEDEFELNYNTLIQANYLFAVRLSDQEFWSAKVKANDKSTPFFAKVVALTANKPNNLYRTFSLLWLGDKAKNYVLSNKEIKQFEPLGVTRSNMLAFKAGNVHKRDWVKLSSRNLDFSKTNPSALINFKLEELLEIQNLTDIYSPLDLKNELAGIDGGSIVYLSTNTELDNENLTNWLFEQFECADIECLNKSILTIRFDVQATLNRTLAQKRLIVYSSRASQFVKFLSVANLVLIKKNEISPSDISSLFLDRLSALYPELGK